MLLPKIKISPLSGDISCVIHLNVVVFPAPFKPNNPKHSPGSMQNYLLLHALFFLNIHFYIFFLNFLF